MQLEGIETAIHGAAMAFESVEMNIQGTETADCCMQLFCFYHDKHLIYNLLLYI